MASLIIFTGTLTAASFTKYDSIILHQNNNGMCVVKAFIKSTGKATFLSIAGQKEFKNTATAMLLIKRLGLETQYDALSDRIVLLPATKSYKDCQE